MLEFCFFGVGLELRFDMLIRRFLRLGVVDLRDTLDSWLM